MSAGPLRPVAAGVFVATSRRDRTNSVVVRSGPDGRCLLVDPAWTPDELERLARELRNRRLPVEAGFSTHAHFDHLLWHPGFGGSPRFASPTTAERARASRAALLAELGPGYPEAVVRLFGSVRPLPSGLLPLSRIEVVALHHDAHESGSSVLWLPAGRVLIAGDLLSDVEIPLLGDGPEALAQYRAALESLTPIVRRSLVVIPGHGTVGVDATARLEADLRYLDALAAGMLPLDRRLASSTMAAAHREQHARLRPRG